MSWFLPTIRGAAFAVPFLVYAAPALADPCEGPLPARNATFSGAVRYVGDGDGLCVGPAGRPDLWIEVRLGDFYAPELHEPSGTDAKRRLERVVLGQVLQCRAGKRSYDRVIGYCALRERPLGGAAARERRPRGRSGLEAMNTMLNLSGAATLHRVAWPKLSTRRRRSGIIMLRQPTEGIKVKARDLR